MISDAGLFGNLCESCFGEMVSAIRPHHWDWAYCRHSGAFLRIETQHDLASTRYTLSGPYRSREDALRSEGIDPDATRREPLRLVAGDKG